MCYSYLKSSELKNQQNIPDRQVPNISPYMVYTNNNPQLSLVEVNCGGKLRFIIKLPLFPASQLLFATSIFSGSPQWPCSLGMP